MAETMRVLIVDDEPGMRLAAERTLRQFQVDFPDLEAKLGFELRQAASGEEGLEVIQSFRPQLLLLDHKLPGMSGLDVLDRIVERKIELLTVMITAYASLETAIRATKLGAFDFLAKPFTPEELRMTVRKAAHHYLLQRRADELAREKRQIRFQFLSVLAHELKAPIAAIEGYLCLLKDLPAGMEPQQFAQVIDRSLLRLEGMRKLIFDLLDLTRIESGQKKRELAEQDLVAIARLCLETVQPSAAARRIELVFEPVGPVVMTADRGEIEIILNNLLSNAVKYNRDDGRVTLTIAREAGRVWIRVADTGIGMTPEEVGRLFGEFVRIKNEQTRKILGSGLGLSIVRRLAHLYGGEVAVDSTPGEGSMFSVWLDPAHGGDAQSATEPAV
ncbi:MAG TPA: hybrid sensor histidine kinase/response regulator [Acidobacteriota bacterium]|nr:hybrid sensor histidine kinase/response regulator [Acidobacteriota bacterium]HNR38595.1 hybrid sensor histidine kinase/response regulator [Acidobacteriota bacterium]HNU01206.1 hybrid sensor histidine kinase/response regulator [Acidobacteriota bacterium]HPB28169.1 hybrid sensor histidine kinase/response regulator [Acidobacteriota bacterium]HQO26607.1 hybrid sensor histidine kinase/response regulator [Acidobacteriota bacterium]